MKNECSIVRELLPLEIEKMVSHETSEIINEHLENCPGCRAEKEILSHSNSGRAEQNKSSDYEYNDRNIIMSVKRIPTDGYKGCKNGVICELKFRKALINIGQFPSGHKWSQTSAIEFKNNSDEIIRLVFADRTIEYSMREDGFYERRDELDNLAEIISSDEMYSVLFGEN